MHELLVVKIDPHVIIGFRCFEEQYQTDRACHTIRRRRFLTLGFVPKVLLMFLGLSGFGYSHSATQKWI